MAIFCDLMILFLAAVVSIIKAGWLPLEELEAIVSPYADKMLWLVVGFFVLKYVVYEIAMFRDIRYINSVDNDMPKSDYYVLIAYPICDVVRMMTALGVTTAIFHKLVPQYATFSPGVTYVALVVLLIAVFFIDYFCKDGEKVLSHLIPTIVFVALVLAVSKGMFLAGLQLL